MAAIDIEVQINDDSIRRKAVSLFDDVTMLRIHEAFAKHINDYVPFNEGMLAQDITISAGYVRYDSVYAHYQYMGIVYAPNIPQWDEDGYVTGWRSPPGKGTKYPTDRKLGVQRDWVNNGKVVWHFGYDLTRHPLATAEWDKVALANPAIKKKFEQDIANILALRARELYGTSG